MGIEPRTQGIFATCVKGREARCVEELYSIFGKVCVTNRFTNGLRTPPPSDLGCAGIGLGAYVFYDVCVCVGWWGVVYRGTLWAI